MDNNVLLSIKTYQDIDGEGGEPIELQTPGMFGMLNGKYYLKYAESELTGYPDTNTTIKVWENNVVVTRQGKFNMQLKYTSGKQNLCLYPTPYGNICASIRTFLVDFDFAESGGRLRVDYSLDADNENFYKNSLNIKVEPLQKG